MRKAIVGLTLTCLMLIGGAARADVIFGVSGQFASPAGDTFGGTMTIDTQDGVINAIDIDALGLDFYHVGLNGPDGPGFVVNATNGVGGDYTLTLAFTTTNIGSLGGFMGGTITGGGITSPSGFTVATGATGSVIPEPATLALLGLGLAGIGFARRKSR